jgi:hypothetical protein
VAPVLATSRADSINNSSPVAKKSSVPCIQERKRIGMSKVAYCIRVSTRSTSCNIMEGILEVLTH